MILTKLQEALGAVETQRRALDQVEKELRSMISRLSGIPDITPPMVATPVVHHQRVSGEEPDKIGEVADILRSEGHPLHITVIAERLSALKGTKILRTSIEPGLNRHVAKTKTPRVDKVGPSTFGLPEWKQSQFAKTA